MYLYIVNPIGRDNRYKIVYYLYARTYVFFKHYQITKFLEKQTKTCLNFVNNKLQVSELAYQYLHMK